ncbi:Ribulose-phosphate 3-epimerase [bioreactor metagenome]|uniref:Ribulose-phosphate 3-epimerase n=1 Tax=bioreactor metagenome TaxID=1076179 RepID=A0A645BEG6_9ZZZZ
MRDAGFQNIQIDVCDGSYSPEVTITPQDLLEFDLTGLSFDFHLMTEEPMDYVWELEEYEGRLPIRAVFGQLERMSYQEAFLEEVKKHNWLAGLAVDLFTPIDSITPEAWDWIDALLLMSVEAGEQGQVFQELVFEKVKLAREKIRQNAEPVRIFIDGGVNLENIAGLEKKVDEVAVGSALLAVADFDKTAEAFLAYNKDQQR